MDFLSLHTISNWVYIRINKFISGSIDSQRNFSQRNCIREEREDEKLTEEDLKTLLQNLGILCSREEDYQEKPLDSDDVMMAFEEKEPSFEEIKEAFDVFDGNRDGFIDPTELQRTLCVLGLKDVGSSLERCKEMIQCFDLNNDVRAPNPPAKLREMRTTQTPSELAASRKSNNPQKIFKKSLSSVVQESADLSPITQVVDENENEFGGNNELEIAANLLKKARLQVLNSDSVNRRSKKLSDLLIETSVDNLPNDSKERDQTSELVNAKIAIVLLFLFFWILALVLYFRNLGGTSSFKGPLPT